MKKLLRSLMNVMVIVIQIIFVIGLYALLTDEVSSVDEKLVGALCALIIMCCVEYVKIDKYDLEE